MNVVHRVLVAIACVFFVFVVDWLLQKLGNKFSVLQKQAVRMVIAYIAGVLIFIIVLRIFM